MRRRIRARLPNTPVLILTNSNEQAELEALNGPQTWAFRKVRQRPPELSETVKAILAGEAPSVPGR